MQIYADGRDLIELFCRSIKEDAPIPISYREIFLTAQIMDDTFTQIMEQRFPERRIVYPDGIPGILLWVNTPQIF